MTTATMNRAGQLDEGEKLKTEVLATLAARRESYIVRGRRVLLRQLLAVGTASADDVRRAVPLPEGTDPRCLGSVPGALARAGIIRRVAFSKSNRPERHASFIAVWELADRAGAIQWLKYHPDQLDPEPEPDATLFDHLNAQALRF